eukprot:3605541-Rhodomonas_salina.1
MIPARSEHGDSGERDAGGDKAGPRRLHQGWHGSRFPLLDSDLTLEQGQRRASAGRCFVCSAGWRGSRNTARGRFLTGSERARVRASAQ